MLCPILSFIVFVLRMAQFDCTIYNSLLFGNNWSAESAEDDRRAIEATDNYVCLPESEQDVPVVQENATHQQLWYPPQPIKRELNTVFMKSVKANTCCSRAKFWEVVNCVLQQLIEMNKILPEDEAEHVRYADKEFSSKNPNCI